MTNKKTELTLEEIQAFLNKQFVGEAVNLSQLVKGEESQAFSFEHGGISYVLRTNVSDEGFQKDAYAYNHFRNAQLL